MILFKKADRLSHYLSQIQKTNRKIGFVPTMGALHDGHLSLIEASKKETDLTVCSIFVNPTQFNNANDYRHYPVTTEKDIEKMLVADCDVLFLPDAHEIYPAGYKAKTYAIGPLESILEGHYRPGHYQGVCQVVDRLLQIVHPSHLYLGAKDFQQCKVLNRLLQLLGKDNEINICIAPTLREKDGLAMSSRNLRLTPGQRAIAPELFNVLSSLKEAFLRGESSAQQLEAQGKTELEQHGFSVDYLQIADAETLLPPGNETKQAIVLVAASLGEIRLIDNLLLN